jgi:hypothetical protein
MPPNVGKNQLQKWLRMPGNPRPLPSEMSALRRLQPAAVRK